MYEVTATITRSQKPELVALVRSLPAMLAGKIEDKFHIVKGFKLRVGYTLLSQILPNFQALGRGFVGVDGTKWPKLSKAYLAYGRRFGPREKTTLKAAYGLGKQNRFGPGSTIGLLTPEQMRLWRQTFSQRLRWYLSKMDEKEAKAKAAAVAWIVVKRAGGKTKLEVFGNREVQILKDNGQLEASLEPGFLTNLGVSAYYYSKGNKGSENQVFDMDDPRLIVVGTNDKKAVFHHFAKKRPLRRLWPRQIPDFWWKKILEAAISGLVHIDELFKGF